MDNEDDLDESYASKMRNYGYEEGEEGSSDDIIDNDNDNKFDDEAFAEVEDTVDVDEEEDELEGEELAHDVPIGLDSHPRPAPLHLGGSKAGTEAVTSGGDGGEKSTTPTSTSANKIDFSQDAESGMDTAPKTTPARKSRSRKVSRAREAKVRSVLEEDDDDDDADAGSNFSTPPSSGGSRKSTDATTTTPEIPQLSPSNPVFEKHSTNSGI